MKTCVDTNKSLEIQFESFMDQLIAQQQEKVLSIARTINPHLTLDDILNPHDFPQLMNHPTFNYEEGLATGLIAAQMGLRAHLFRDLVRDLARNPVSATPSAPTEELNS